MAPVAVAASDQRPSGVGKVPVIDVSNYAPDEGGEARADTPSPSGLTVKQKIKWHETAVAPEGGTAAGAGAARLKRSQSARPAVEAPRYGVLPCNDTRASCDPSAAASPCLCAWMLLMVSMWLKRAAVHLCDDDCEMCCYSGVCDADSLDWMWCDLPAPGGAEADALACMARCPVRFLAFAAGG